jgi:hypothetical protein
VDVLEEISSSFGDRHCDCVSGEEGEDSRGRSDEFGLEISFECQLALISG